MSVLRVGIKAANGWRGCRLVPVLRVGVGARAGCQCCGSGLGLGMTQKIVLQRSLQRNRPLPQLFSGWITLKQVLGRAINACLPSFRITYEVSLGQKWFEGPSPSPSSTACGREGGGLGHLCQSFTC